MDNETNNLIRSLNLLSQVQQIGLNSWGDIKKREPNKSFELPSIDDLIGDKKEMINKQLVRQEQIQAYLEKEKAPVIVNGQAFKYNSIPEPVIDEAEIDDLNNEIETNKIDLNNYISDINDYRKAIKDNNDLILEGEKIIREYQKQLTAFKEEWENVKIELASADTEENKNLLKDGYKFFLKSIYEVNDKIKNIEKQIVRIKNENNVYENEISNLLTYIDNIKNNIENSNSKKNEVEKENSIKVKNYENDLRAINSGSFNVDRMSGESDAQYAQRLTTTSLTPYDNSMNKTFSDIERNNEFKENLKSLFKNNSFIETILNYFRTSNDSYIFTFNKYFNLFKKDYLRLYGFNNKSVVDDPEIFIDLVKNFCETDKTIIKDGKQITIPKLTLPTQELTEKSNTAFLDPIMKKIDSLVVSKLKRDDDIRGENDLMELEDLLESSKNDFDIFDDTIEQLKSNKKKDIIIKTPEGFPDNIIFEFYDNDTLLNIRKEGVKKNNYIRYIDKQFNLTKFGNPVNKYPPTILRSEYPDYGGFIELSNSGFVNFLKKFTGVDDDTLKNFFKSKTLHNIEGHKINNIFNEFGLKPTIVDNTNKPHLRLINPNKVGDNTIGMGLKNNIPEYVKFGKYTLLYKKLFLKNILSLHKNNHQKIAGFKNYNVSNEFVELIKKLLDNKKLEPSDINNLKIGERELLDRLLTLCELNKKIITGTGNDTIKNAKENLKVIEGQIEAGNNNPIMKDELYKAIFKLVNFGIITEKQGREHYKKICFDFF